MIPCKSNCEKYFEGCHKCCAYWEKFQESNRIEREKKKAYLNYHNQICKTVISQCYSIIQAH